MRWTWVLAVFAMTLLTAGELDAQTTAVSGDGYIESTAGGFKFPDGSVQATAVSSNEMWPVQCYLVGLPLQPVEDRTMNCQTFGGGPHFVDGTDVPDDHVFVVTDVLITPLGAETSGTNVVGLHIETESVLSFLVQFRNVDTSSMSHHFHSPILSLPPGTHLNAEANHTNPHSHQVYVRGFMLSDLSTYRP